MAGLDSPHWEAVPSPARDLMSVLGTLPVLRSFYLAGSTVLALRLGHRIVLDLDLFANTVDLDESLRHRISEGMLASHTVRLLQDSSLSLLPAGSSLGPRYTSGWRP